MTKTLTLTIPSYNVEEFLEQTLNSFVDDSILNDIEVIIVDDGSKDNTAKIAKAYEEKYKNTFKLISKENGGHGSTINAGIKNATGKYFKVIDGDDWVNTEQLVELIKYLKKSDVDMIFTNYIEFYEDIKTTKKIEFLGFENDTEYTFEEISDKEIIPMHSLAFKTEILQKNNIVIDENSFYVDVEYILFPIPFIKTVKFFDLYIYVYRLAQANQSVSINGFQKHIDNHLNVIDTLLDFSEQYSKSDNYNPKYLGYINRRIADMVCTQGAVFSSYSVEDKEIKEQFIKFDNMIKNRSIEIYNISSSLSPKLKLLRKTNFKFYKTIQRLSKIKNK